MLENYSSGYHLWTARVNEQEVRSPSVSQTVFEELCEEVYSKTMRRPLLMRIGSGYVPVSSSSEITDDRVLAVPESQEVFDFDLPVSVGILVAKEWFVNTVASWEVHPSWASP